MNKRLTIILTASFDKGLFCNGLNQNIVTLAELITDLGHNAILAIDHDKGKSISAPSNLAILDNKELLHLTDVDYILQTAWVVNDSLVELFKNNNPKCKNVHVHYGNRLLADIEQCKWDTRAVKNYDVDEVWVSPHYDFSIQYFKTYYNTQKVFILPYIWSDKYVKEKESELNSLGKSCFYDPKKEKSIGILEPNLNMTKNCIPSIMIAEEAYRNNKNLFKEVNVYCSSAIMEKRYFRELMWCLDITRGNSIFFAGRKNLGKIFSEESNVIVSHQLLNALNYTYLEALYFNIPLIHNSEYLYDIGYYYKDYNTQDGGKALTKALLSHDSNLEEYKKKAEEAIYRYSPLNPQVQDEYRKLLS